jgi:cell division protein FtsZ
MIISQAADPDANIIFGATIDETMGDKIKISVIATGFDNSGFGPSAYKRPSFGAYDPNVRQAVTAGFSLNSKPAAPPEAQPSTPEMLQHNTVKIKPASESSVNAPAFTPSMPDSNTAPQTPAPGHSMFGAFGRSVNPVAPTQSVEPVQPSESDALPEDDDEFDIPAFLRRGRS